MPRVRQLTSFAQIVPHRTTHILNKRRVFQPEMVVNRDLYVKCYDGEVEQVREALANGADPNRLHRIFHLADDLNQPTLNPQESKELT